VDFCSNAFRSEGELEMEEEIKRIVKMKNIYELQVEKLKEDWKNNKSNFCKIKDYKIQLSIWEKRILQYDNELIILYNNETSGI
jgi:hypothetical protein